MDLKQLECYASEQLARHGLTARGWRFAFDGARTRLGSCRYRSRLITVSGVLAGLNDEEVCIDTVLHEIAHALAGHEAGHGPEWKHIAQRLGARPERCTSSEEVTRPEPPYWAICPTCGRKSARYRRPRAARACGDCCRAHAGGRYDARYRLQIVASGSGNAARPAAGKSPLYAAVCPGCGRTHHFFRKRNRDVACGPCCDRFAGGRFDPRFALQIKRLR